MSTDTIAPEASIGLPELRFCVAPLTQVQVRDASETPDGTWRLSGYAAVFGQETILYDGQYIRIKEVLDPAAFDAVLRDQPMNRPEGVVHLNVGHDMNLVLAATNAPGQRGRLTLSSDKQGLYYDAFINPEVSYARDAGIQVRDGVLAQASFAFTVAKAQWTDLETDDGPDESTRTIVEIKHLYDVCACPQGAYPQTVSQLRSIAAAIGHTSLADLRAADGGQPRPNDEGVSSVDSSDEERAADHTVWQERMRVRIAQARHHHPLKETA